MLTDLASSVYRVAKKEKILQMEAAKLEALLCQRNEMLGGLRESHEYLLMTNGQLQYVAVQPCFPSLTHKINSILCDAVQRKKSTAQRNTGATADNAGSWPRAR